MERLELSHSIYKTELDGDSERVIEDWFAFDKV